MSSPSAYSHPQGNTIFSLLEEDLKFRKIFAKGVIFLVIMGLIVPFLPVIEPPREALEKLPPQMARVIIPKKEAPKPKKPKVVKPKPKLEPKPKPKPKPEKKPVAKKPKPVKQAKKVAQKAKAREKAKQTGLAAFSDDLASLRESVALPTAKKVKTKNSRSPNPGNGQADQTARNLLAANAKSASGATSRRSATRTATASNLQTIASTVVDAKDVGEDKGTLVNQGETRISQAAGSPRESVRDEESIRRTFERNKSAIFTIYNRALRKNSSLQGKVTIALEIDPNGQVIACKLISSELDDPKLEQKIVRRVKLLNFGAQNVSSIKFEYTFDFLPS